MKDIFYPVAHRSQDIIDGFKTRYNDFDDHLIPEIVQYVIGVTPTKVTQSTSAGTAHVIYYLTFSDRDDLVFRANINIPEPEVEMLAEKLITDLASEHKIPTNKILHVDISRDSYNFDYSIQERLGGIDPEDEFNGTEEEYARFCFETGQAIARLGKIKLPGFGRFDEGKVKSGQLVGSKEKLSDYLQVCLDEDLSELEKFKVITKQQSEKIVSFFEANKGVVDAETGSLAHYDLADHNLRYKDGHLEAIFDWETAVVASPSLDLASCPTWKSHFPKREKLLEGYTSIEPLPANYDQLEKIYLLRTMIWKIRFAIRAGILNEDRKNLFYRALEKASI